MASTNFSNPTQLGLQTYQKFAFKETFMVKYSLFDSHPIFSTQSYYQNTICRYNFNVLVHFEHKKWKVILVRLKNTILPI